MNENNVQDNLSTPPNWENQPESFLAEIKIWEVCVDWSNIGETSKEFALN